METKQESSFELLSRYGSRWAVLAAMSMDMSNKGIQLPDNVSAILEKTRIEIKSGCYSTCEIDGNLNQAEGELISKGCMLGESYLDKWFDLLARVMQGRLDYDEMIRIPALKPVENACGFLNCRCS